MARIDQTSKEISTSFNSIAHLRLTLQVLQLKFLTSRRANCIPLTFHTHRQKFTYLVSLRIYEVTRKKVWGVLSSVEPRKIIDPRLAVSEKICWNDEKAVFGLSGLWRIFFSRRRGTRNNFVCGSRQLAKKQIIRNVIKMNVDKHWETGSCSDSSFAVTHSPSRKTEDNFTLLYQEIWLKKLFRIWIYRMRKRKEENANTVLEPRMKLSIRLVTIHIYCTYCIAQLDLTAVNADYYRFTHLFVRIDRCFK